MEDKGQKTTEEQEDTDVQLAEDDVLYLDGAVNSSGEEASSGNGQSCNTTLVSEQGLGTDHVVHAPHLQIHNKQINTFMHNFLPWSFISKTQT